MVHIDWKKIMAITPEHMTEGEKDDLYEVVAWNLPDYSTDRKHLIKFVRVIQEILRFKSEQVESLMNELDEIAAKQGEEEARDRQDLVNEIDRLKDQLEYCQRLGRDNDHQALNSEEELKSEIVKLEIQNEELLLELHDREKDLMNEKRETENYARQVIVLEKEKEELRRELSALHEEVQEKVNERNVRGSPEFGPEKQEELTELIRQKNKHITQLLDDIEILEKQNLTLKSKLSNVCDELSDATKHINEMTMHLSQMKHINEELEKKISDSEERNASLIVQIEELIDEKAKHDKQLDQLSEVLNSKVQEWKDALEAKDVQICKAEEEIRKLLASSVKFSECDEMEVKQRVSKQEQEITSLKNELVKATYEINNCTELIENFKEKQSQLKFEDSDNYEAQILMYEEKIRYLEDKLKYAEEDAQTKAEEVSDIIILLREYEMGEFGLSEALSKIKHLEKNLEKKDLQIEKLVESCNNMELEFENLEEQNLALRERLGISATEEIDTTSVKIKFKKDLEVIENLKFQLDKKEEELVRAKLKCRKLLKFIKLKPRLVEDSESSFDELKEERRISVAMKKFGEEKLNLESRLESIIKENDALRKGMHEILDSIQKQDSAGTVEIQSQCLERLLEALDSRHVSGWYHPAMRLQAQLNNAEGKNEELRNQIRLFRKEEKNKNSELQEAYLKIRSLENQIFILQTPREESVSKSRTPDSELVDAEFSSNDKQSLNTEQEQKIVSLEIEVQELKLSLNKSKREFEKLERVKLMELEELSSKITGLEKQVSFLEGNSEGEVIELSRLQSELKVQERQIDFLKIQLTQERDNNEQLHVQMLREEEKRVEEILRLQSNKVAYALKIEKLEKELLDCVPKSKISDINKELTETTAKYQDAVSLTLSRYEDNTIERLDEEIRLLHREKNEVLDELRVAKEKLLQVDRQLKKDAILDSSASEVAILAEKLAASEVRELNEKQKSAHLEKVNLTLKSELQDLEAYNKEMTDFVTELKEVKRRFHEAQQDATQPLLLKEEECIALQETVDNLKRKLKVAENDRENFRELFEISQGQFKSLENYKEKDKMRIACLNEQVLLLQSAGDEKAIVARLSHELLMCQLSKSELAKEKNDLQDRVAKLLAKNLLLEAKINEFEDQNYQLKRKHIAEYEVMHSIISDFRKLYGMSAVFPSIEIVYKIKKRLKIMQDEERRRIKELKNEIQEYWVKKEEFTIKMEGLTELEAAFKGNADQLMLWYKEGTSLRLEEAKFRRQNQFLSGELEQLENYVKKIDEEIISLEESSLAREKQWEGRQILWEQSRFENITMIPKEEKAEVKVKALLSVQDESTETAALDDDACEMKRIIEDQAEKIKEYEIKMQNSKDEIEEMKLILNQKEVNSYEKNLGKFIYEDMIVKDVSDEAEKTALKVTVQSLQNIIGQKEETIRKYQELLKEGRDEYTKSSGILQEELRTLHEALAKQSKAYAKLKTSLESNHQLKEGLPKIFEKYLTKIHELEDDLTECQMNLANTNSQLLAAQQEREKWQTLAEERLSLLDRLQNDHRSEIEGYKIEIKNFQTDIEQLKRVADLGHPDGTGDHGIFPVGIEIQSEEKEYQYESDSGKEKVLDCPEKISKNKNSAKEIKILERQLKFAREESSRLREQLKLAQMQKIRRAKTAISATSRSEPKASLAEESLQSKLKTLEELLKIAKEREQEMIEANQRKIKSAEEVARWGERKKAQHTIQNLNSKLKEKEAEIEVLKNKNESFRNMIHKYERDRNGLETQLKAAKGSSNNISSRLEKVTAEKAQLEKELAEVKEKLDFQLRHQEAGSGTALLYDKLESQERKLAVLELTTKGRSTVTEELTKLQSAYTCIEKSNLKLESENMALHLRLEKEKLTVKRLTERNTELEKMFIMAEEEAELRKQESNRTISSLSERLEKLGKISEMKKNNRVIHSSKLATCPEKLKKDYAKLKEDHKALRAKYLEVVDKNHELEEEVKKCRYQINLLEEKDLADSVSKTNNLQLASQLSQELLQVKSQLTHKTHLLNRVKVLLTKAAAKEKALNEKVSALQSMVPTSVAG